MTPKYFTSFENSHIEPLMKMSDKPHCLFTEDLKYNRVQQLGGKVLRSRMHIDLFHVLRYCFLNNALGLCGSMIAHTYSVVLSKILII